MGKVFDGIDDSLASWITQQHLFFVATAPLSEDGRVNVSPRGLDSLSILDQHTVAWLDLTGSGAETIAHLNENGRICIMFCAFDSRPRIVRLHGRGRVVLPGDEIFERVEREHPGHVGARAVIVVDVERASDSCGWGVPADGLRRRPRHHAAVGREERSGRARRLPRAEECPVTRRPAGSSGGGCGRPFALTRRNGSGRSAASGSLDLTLVVTRLSHFFLRTLREDPADAEVTSHRLLVRAGYIRRTAPGIFTWLPLGLKVKAKIEGIIRDEMTNAGAYEVHFPALVPADPYRESGRWEAYGDGIFRLKDRRGSDYLLAPTHEELFTLLVKDLYSSYKDLPLAIYQIQDKYRDEARPRAGLLRGREFTMKDAYSFDYTDAGLDASYQAQRDAYERIFQRLGLEYVIVNADNGLMGGARSEEFLHPIAVGEDTFVRIRRRLRRERRGVHDRRARPDSLRRARCAGHLRLAEHADHPDARRSRERPPRRPGVRHRRTRDRRGGGVDRGAHAQERRARPHAPGRHARDRRRRHPGRPRRRRQARRGRLRPGRGRRPRPRRTSSATRSS